MLKLLPALPITGVGFLAAKAVEFQFFGGRERYREFNRKAKETALEHIKAVKLFDRQECTQNAPHVDEHQDDNGHPGDSIQVREADA